MPDSNSNLTRESLVRWALRRVCNTTPTVQDIVLATNVLNSLVKRLDKDGTWLWAVSNTPSTLNLVAGQKSYVVADGLQNDILQLHDSGVYLDRGNNTRVYLRVLSKSESLSSYEHESSGEPYLVYLERAPLMTNNKLWVLPEPNSAYTLKYHYQRRLYDFDLPSDNPDFPQEWQEPLSVILADSLSDEYKLPLQERQWLQLKAKEFLKEMTMANGEDIQEPALKTEFF